MPTFSQTDLATRVLRDLAIIAPDEAASDDDLQDTIEVITSEIASMAARGLSIANGSESVIPQEYLSALSRRLGLALAPSFGIMGMDKAVAAIPAAESYLRQLSARLPTGEIVEATYF